MYWRTSRSHLSRSLSFSAMTSYIFLEFSTIYLFWFCAVWCWDSFRSIICLKRRSSRFWLASWTWRSMICSSFSIFCRCYYSKGTPSFLTRNSVFLDKCFAGCSYRTKRLLRMPPLSVEDNAAGLVLFISSMVPFPSSSPCQPRP